MHRSFGQKYEDVNISWNMDTFQKVLSTKSFYFLFLNPSWKLNLDFSFRKRIFTLYVFDENFKIWKNVFARKNPLIIIKKKIIFFFKFYIWIWKICRNRLVLVWDIANLWFRDNVQNLKTRFVFEKYVPKCKKCHLQNRFSF